MKRLYVLAPALQPPLVVRAATTDWPTDRANLAASLWRAAKSRASGQAIVDGGTSATFEELRARSAAVAHHLTSNGVLPGDRVALFLERGIDAAAALFGTWASGAVGVCVNDRLRPRQIEHILRHCGTSVLLTTAEMLERNSRSLDTSAAILDVAAIATSSVCTAITPTARRADDYAQIIYTSGSTGLPKGVTFTHGSVAAAIDIVAGYLRLRAIDRIVSLMPFSSVYGLNQLLCAVQTGACLVIETSPLASRIVATLREQGVTVAAAVPPLWSQLVTQPEFRKPLPSLRQLQNAGGHLPPAVSRQLRTLQPNARLVLQYGMTETFRSTYLPPSEVDRRPHSMGLPIPETEIFVARDDLTLCEPEEVGELVHSGPSIASGYWNDRAATERVFRPNPFGAADGSGRVVFSGDLVRRDQDGFLYYVARRDRLIKTLGFRVGPDEISDVLFASGEIDECVVTTEPDAHRGDRIVAFVVLAADGSLERLLTFSRLELPRHMQPARVEAVRSLPRLASGKYDVAGLHTREGSGQGERALVAGD